MTDLRAGKRAALLDAGPNRNGDMFGVGWANKTDFGGTWIKQDFEITDETMMRYKTWVVQRDHDTNILHAR